MGFLNNEGLAHLWSIIKAQLGNKVDKESGKMLSTNDYTTEEKNKLAGIEAGANRIVVDSSLSSSSANPVQNKVVNSAISNLNTLVGNTAVSTQISNAITAQKGNASGLATLDENGKVLSTQLPSYVDDVLEGYLSSSKFYKTKASDGTYYDEIIGEAGKIYVDLNTNKTYRWSGSTFVVISETLALGETSSTAFQGDRGKAAYDHAAAKGTAFSPGLYKITTNAQGHVIAATAVEKADITGLGIPAQDTTYNTATASANGLMSSGDKSKLDGIAAGANKTTVDSALSSTSTNPVQNKVVNTAINNLVNIVGNEPIPTQVSNAIDEMAVQVDLNGAPEGDALTNNADTLGGKTLAQIESQISNAMTYSTSRTWTVTVPSSGWETDSLTFMGVTCGYKNVVSVVGMTSDVSIDLVKYNSGDVTAARSYICQDTGVDVVTFWAKSALATFSVKLTEVR